MALYTTLHPYWLCSGSAAVFGWWMGVISLIVHTCGWKPCCLPSEGGLHSHHALEGWCSLWFIPSVIQQYYERVMARNDHSAEHCVIRANCVNINIMGINVGLGYLLLGQNDFCLWNEFIPSTKAFSLLSAKWKAQVNSVHTMYHTFCFLRTKEWAFFNFSWTQR